MIEYAAELTNNDPKNATAVHGIPNPRKYGLNDDQVSPDTTTHGAVTQDAPLLLNSLNSSYKVHRLHAPHVLKGVKCIDEAGNPHSKSQDDWV
jgi:hypothetical protein